MTHLRQTARPRHARHSSLSRAVWVALATLGGWAGSAQAQSLQSLYEAARAFDATYSSARAAADAAQARADQAKALWLPTVGLTASTTVSSSEGGTDSTTGPLTVKSRSDSDTRTTTVGIGASQPLFNPANTATQSQAERSLKIAQAQLSAAEQDLIVRVSQAYFDVLAAADALTTVQASKKQITEQLASAKRNFEVGTATITDTREAQARFDLNLAQELAAENDLRVKRLALEQLVGRGDLKPNTLRLPVTLPPVLPAGAEEWVNTADANNLSVQQARLGEEVAKLETSKARAGHLPTVQLDANYGRNYYGGSTSVTSNVSDPTSQRSINSSGASIGISLKLPLFAGFAVQNRVKETLSLEEKARADLDTARRSVAQATRQVFYGVQSGAAQVKALEAAESSSKLALEATQLGYKVGVRVNLDVLNAQTQLAQTQRDLAKARYDVIVGGLKLRQAAGVLKPEDVQAVDRLLAP